MVQRVGLVVDWPAFSLVSLRYCNQSSRSLLQITTCTDERFVITLSCSPYVEFFGTESIQYVLFEKKKNREMTMTLSSAKSFLSVEFSRDFVS